MQSKLRKATEKDKDLLFQWANDSECRKNSLNSELISYESHCKWFASKLNSQFCDMYIYMYQGQETGQIRIDYQGKNGQISYSVAKEFRGQGHGGKILQLIEEEMIGKIEYLTGIVKRDNIPSQLKFEQNGYEKEVLGDIISYRKRVTSDEE